MPFLPPNQQRESTEGKIKKTHTLVKKPHTSQQNTQVKTFGLLIGRLHQDC